MFSMLAFGALLRDVNVKGIIGSDTFGFFLFQIIESAYLVIRILYNWNWRATMWVQDSLMIPGLEGYKTLIEFLKLLTLKLARVGKSELFSLFFLFLSGELH